jgi:hypothetical protein
MRHKAISRGAICLLLAIAALGTASCATASNVSTTEQPTAVDVVSSAEQPTDVEVVAGADAGAEDSSEADAGSETTGEAPEPPPGGAPGGAPGGGEPDHGTYANLVTEDVADAESVSTAEAENAVRVEGDTEVTLTNVVIAKSGDAGDSGDNSNFYGLNAGLLALDQAVVTLDNATVTTTSDGSNGIFSYGDSVVHVNNANIHTTANSAGGIMVAGGGTMYLTDSTIETEGDHSAAFRTDRGGGTLVVDGGDYLTHGQGSPAVYSAAEISVADAVLTATGSEAVVIEGKNSVELENCTVEGDMSGEQSGENIQNVMTYQSMSGDADVGKSLFSMTGGALTSNNGDMIYVTNTDCEIYLSDVDIALSNDVLLKVAGNDSARGWGESGANGGQAVFTAESQSLEGQIIVDEISSLDMSLLAGSSFVGSINATDEGSATSVTIDETSTWILTAA